MCEYKYAILSIAHAISVSGALSKAMYCGSEGLGFNHR